MSEKCSFTKLTFNLHMISQTFCRLCGNEAELQDSHIVSKFVWRMSKVIGNGSPFHAICLNHPNLSEKYQQDGFKEPLLCKNCERQRSAYENLASRSLFRNVRNLKIDGRHTIMTGLDYKALKLYSMFQIWMMGESTHPFYSHVRLGPHSARIANLLRDENPAEPWRYGNTIALIGNEIENFSGIFSQPEQARLSKHYIYRFVVAGLHSYHFVSGHPPELGFQYLFLQEDGSWPIFRSRISDYPELIERLHQTSNLSRAAGIN